METGKTMPGGTIAWALARKSRTPPPPKRSVQAPKRRVEERDNRRTLLILGGIAAVLAVLVGVGAFLTLGGSDSDAATGPAALREAGCRVTTHDARDNLRPRLRHVRALPKGFKYTSDPPTSGLHFDQTVIWGAYDQAVDQTQAVHNLEHGGVTIQYGDDVPRSDVGKLTELYREDPNGLILAPYPKLGDKIALAAWTFDESKRRDRNYEGTGRLAVCPRFDEDAIEAFLDEYRFKGPERFPADSLAPGNP